MAVPKKRTPSSKRNMRRSHHGIKASALMNCPKCKTAILPHVACPTCGTYRGRAVIDVNRKLDKQERRRREKAREQQG